jgi:hypothetical protein
MAQRRARPVRFSPKGCSDAVDGSNVFPGAMAQLANLAPDPAMAGSFVPRPAAYLDISFAALGFASPGFISSLLVVGNLAYGTIASARNPFNDEPFCVNLLTQTVVPVSGITDANTPSSPPSSGVWTPPIVAQVGSRVVVTHPGFPGGSVKFGWFDVSGFTETTAGNIVLGSDLITGAPLSTGEQPGMTVAGVGIPPGAVIVSTAEYVNDTTGRLNEGATQLTVASLTGIVVGQTVMMAGVPAGVVVVGISGSTVTLSGPASVSGVGVLVHFETQTAVTVTSGSDLLLGVNSNLIGVGQIIAAYGVPNGTTVLSVGPGFVQMSAPGGVTVADSFATFYAETTADVTVSPTILTSVAFTDGISFGNTVAGEGIPTGATVVSVAGSSVTISQAATVTADGVAITFAGTTITLSAAATASANGLALTISGGSTAAPLWGAGDTDRNSLPSVPVGVAQFNGRAYYALGLNGIVFSDSGFACRVSNNPFVQALTPADGLPITAVAPLMLSSPLVSTGIVQALLAFEGVAKIQQITGDPTTSNLAMNALPVATGTSAPLTITTCELGTAFVSPEGLRLVQFNGSISDPTGDAGSGITLPFVYSSVASRMCASATAHTIRISTQNGNAMPPAQQEWWWDIGRKIWTGPMSFPVSLIQPWPGVAEENKFIIAPIGIPATLWISDVVPYPVSNYVENGRQLQWAYQPTPLPDTGEMAMNTLVDMAISAQFLNFNSITAEAFDIDGVFLDTVPIPPGGQASTFFNQVTGKWVAPTSSENIGRNFQQFPVYWHRPIVFKQLSLTISGQSHFGIRIANLNMRYQATGYPLPVPAGIVTWAGPRSP